MKNVRFTTLIIGAVFLGCSLRSETHSSESSQKDSISTTTVSLNEKEEIQKLIRQTLNWADSRNSIDLLPGLKGHIDSIYIGFDMNTHRLNLKRLKKTGFFTTEFIENYDHIILTLDKKLRNKEFEWKVGELPTFPFANEVDPWTLNQDVPYDKPNPWDLIEVEVIRLNSDKGDLVWKWGKPELNNAPGWKEFRYKFKVTKENGKWKISYLQGFDFKESTK